LIHISHDVVPFSVSMGLLYNNFRQLSSTFFGMLVSTHLQEITLV